MQTKMANNDKQIDKHTKTMTNKKTKHGKDKQKDNNNDKGTNQIQTNDQTRQTNNKT